MAGFLNRFSSLLLRATLLIPLVFSIISGILVSVTLSSGSSPGNLENLAMFKLDLSKIDVARGLQPENTTTVSKREVIVGKRGVFDDLLGAATGGLPAVTKSPPAVTKSLPASTSRPLAPTAKSTASTSTNMLGDSVSGQSGNLRGAIGKALADGSAAGLRGLVQPLIQSVSDNIQTGLGVPQWISLHPRTICNGNFTDQNDSNSAVEVRSCTQPGKRPSGLGEVIGLDGPLQNITARVPLPKVLNESNKLLLDGVSLLGTTLTVLFVFAAIFSFFSALANFIAIIAPRNNIVVVLNTVLTATAATLVTGIFVGSSIIITVLVNTLNKTVEDFKIVAQLGSPFLGIGIGATLLSLGAAGIWSVVFAIHFRATAVMLFKMIFTKKREVQTEMVTAEKTYII